MFHRWITLVIVQLNICILTCTLLITLEASEKGKDKCINMHRTKINPSQLLIFVYDWEDKFKETNKLLILMVQFNKETNKYQLYLHDMHVSQL